MPLNLDIWKVSNMWRLLNEYELILLKNFKQSSHMHYIFLSKDKIEEKEEKVCIPASSVKKLDTKFWNYRYGILSIETEIFHGREKYSFTHLVFIYCSVFYILASTYWGHFQGHKFDMYCVLYTNIIQRKELLYVELSGVLQEQWAWVIGFTLEEKFRIWGMGFRQLHFSCALSMAPVQPRVENYWYRQLWKPEGPRQETDISIDELGPWIPLGSRQLIVGALALRMSPLDVWKENTGPIEKKGQD